VVLLLIDFKVVICILSKWVLITYQLLVISVHTG